MILQILLFSVLAILIGLALCFLGYAAFRILFPIWGFLVGLWLGADLVVSTLGGGFLTTSLGIVLGLVLGLVFAAIAYYVYAFAVVLFGATLGYVLGAGFMLLLGVDPGFLTSLVGLVAAILLALGFVYMKFPRVLLMVLTAFAGATAMIAGLLILFGQIPPSQLGLGFVNAYIHTSWFWWLIWLVVGLFGAIVQYQTVEVAESTMVPAEYSYGAVTKEAEKASKEQKSTTKTTKK